MNTVKSKYEKLDAKRRELDMMIFSIVRLYTQCEDVNTMDTEMRQTIIKTITKKVDEIACAEKKFVLDVLGRT